MTVVDHNVRSTGFVPDHVDALRFGGLAPIDGTFEEAVTEHAEAEEGEGDVLGEEDLSDDGGDAGEGVADAADYDVLEEGAVLDER